MTFASGTGLAIGILSAIFLASVIWRAHPNAPAAAFWSFAILATIPLIALLAGPVLLERLGNLSEIETTEKGVTIRIKDNAVRAEAKAAAAEHRTDQLEKALEKNHATVPPPEPRLGWQLDKLGFGDCAGRDFGATEGPKPDDKMCTSTNQTAICWDGIDFVNRSQFGGRPWCTYKGIPPQQCTSGSSPGRMFRCNPQT